MVLLGFVVGLVWVRRSGFSSAGCVRPTVRMLEPRAMQPAAFRGTRRTISS